MMVQIDPNSPIPISEQLRGQIERLIVSGRLSPGSRLPTIRDLANDLGLARGTINKVYDSLARDGLVETRGRHGTRVLGGAGRRPDSAGMTAAADALAVVALQSGMPDAAAHAALDDALGRLRART